MSIVKGTSLAAIIAFAEVTHTGKTINSSTFNRSLF